MKTRTVGRGPMRLLIWALFGLAALVCVRIDQVFLGGYPVGVDAEIPLRAARRWLDGGIVYDPAAFAVTGGPDLPFLYPPALLPFLAPLAELPRTAVLVGWLAVTAWAAIVALRWLGLGWLPVLAFLAWPPFLEALLGGNVQLLLFLAFVVLFFPERRAGGLTALPAPESRDLGVDSRPAAVPGVLAALLGSIKVSQLHSWFHLLAVRPSAAVAGLGVVAAVAAASVVVTGIELWFAWVAQAGRSGDPAWVPVGIPLSTLVGRPAALALTAATVIGALLARGRWAGHWIGVLTIVGAPAMHTFGFVLLVPALLSVHRAVAIAAAALIGTTVSLAWIGVGMVAAALLLQARTTSETPRARAGEAALPKAA